MALTDDEYTISMLSGRQIYSKNSTWLCTSIIAPVLPVFKSRQIFVFIFPLRGCLFHADYPLYRLNLDLRTFIRGSKIFSEAILFAIQNLLW